MTHDFTGAVLKHDAEASIQEKQLFSIKKAVTGLIEFVTTSLDQMGIDKLHELVDPSLDELDAIIIGLSEEAKKHNDLNLQQVLLIAQMLINDIKLKNPEMCESSSRMLKKANF
ncbi:hypothetical protein CJD50_22270 [Hafnia paralvei]|uniref:Uncharacterized protein n=1 Tax=Hafnia paralvei TaxID=546367 RepID=A0A2A2M7S9_9GAMM|nr:hypothetical protein [Hafnia paralvei]EFV40482.1 hypothetical protein HMPREF0864_02213 [Enterobacteriaceae bacterium 9_2_54FAA]PAV94164.1 hypothetical protein CJD50_22270 [Hafnia paralvei]